MMSSQPFANTVHSYELTDGFIQSTEAIEIRRRAAPNQVIDQLTISRMN